MDSWKKLIKTFNNPIVRRKYPLTNVLNVEINRLTESERSKEIIELKKFIVENQPFPPDIFKNPYFKSQTGVALYFPNIFSFHPDRCSLLSVIDELIQELFPNGIPQTIERRNYVNELVTEVDDIVNENNGINNVQSIYDLFENERIKLLMCKIKADLSSGGLNPNDLIDDLMVILEPLLEGETAEKELLKLIYNILSKMKNKEDLDISVISPILYKFQNLLTF